MPPARRRATATVAAFFGIIRLLEGAPPPLPLLLKGHREDRTAPSSCGTDQTFTLPSPWQVARRVPHGLKQRSEAASPLPNRKTASCSPVPASQTITSPRRGRGPAYRSSHP